MRTSGLKQARRLWRDPMFRQGVRDTLPIMLGVGSWGMVAGAAMVKSGLPPALVVFMSLLVGAGTVQVATVPLIVAGAPHWLVWATGLCICLRFIVFSFQYRPYFAHLPKRQRVILAFFTGDSNFALFLRRFPDPRPEPGQLPYVMGGALFTFAVWQGCIAVGATVGNAIPQSWGLAFAGTMALMALACGQLRDRSTWVAAGVAAGTSVAAYGLPLRLNVLVAIVAAVAVGVIGHHAGRARRGGE